MRSTLQFSYLAVTFFTLWIWAAGPVSAQVVSGVVLNENDEPLQDAHVEVANSEIRTVTSEDGSFVLDITSIPGYENESGITLRVTRIGYRAEKVSIRVKSIRDTSVSIRMKPTVYSSDTVVITATRTIRDLEEVSIPISVVSGEEIRRSGSMRLSDVLSEQTGMQIVNDHGTGIQVQGFAPDYTKIMIDGNPVIGRTAGTLDLTRISVQNVKQVEIVKGPSSALWGSDALAGVVNIITDRSQQPFTWGLNSRYGENSTLDLSGNVSFQTDSWRNDLFVNRNSSGGYRMNPNSVAQTVPVYENYTLSYQTDLDLTDRVRFQTSLRYFGENQDNNASITSGSGSQQILDYDSHREDFMVRPSLSLNPIDRLNMDISYLYSFYNTDSEYIFRDSGELYEATQFSQYYNQPELQAGYRWTNRHHTVLGGGAIFERLEAERYPSQPEFTTRFLFAQHSWNLLDELELTGGLRYDTHSEYSSQVSPKISARYKATDWLQFRGSMGRGFKAPEFRQLFLDFTNATAGYSVFGSSTVVEGITRLQNEGNVSQILVPLSNLEEIKAESSWAANLGFDLDPFDSVRLRVNLFRNNVTDLIETAPIARLTNGQAAYSYFNLQKVYTQGAETEIRWQITPDLQTSIGYQFLDARRFIENERTVQNSEGEIETRLISTYEPMFNRSRHSGNVKLFYENESGWGANIRGNLRGKYGLYDLNGNGFVDENEYESGYTTWNAAVSKKLFDALTLQGGVDNALNYTNINVPNLPGRLWYLQASIQL